MKRKYNRRQFIKGAGQASLVLPFLPSMFPHLAYAQSGGIPTRVVLLQMRDGTFKSEYWPQVNPTQMLDRANNVYGYSLNSINGPISNIFNSSWDRLRNKFSLVTGLGYLHAAFHKTSGPYSAGTDISGKEEDPPLAGSTIDCILENSAKFGQQNMPLSPIRISSRRTFSFWRPNGGKSAVERIPYISGDQTVFDSVFKGMQIPKAGEDPPVKPPQPEVDHQPLILDQVLTQFSALSNHRRISSEDKMKLERHASMVQDLQKRVIANSQQQVSSAGITSASVSCGQPSQRFQGTNGNQGEMFRNYMDTITAAFACDLTRIATIFLDRFDDAGSISAGTHHANSHSPQDSTSARKNCREWQGWAFDKVAYLMKKMDSVTMEDGKSLLDHSIIVVANEDGLGNYHSPEGLQLFIAGGANGRLKMGEYIDYRRRPFEHRKSNADLVSLGLPWPGALISIMQAAGLNSSDYSHQGESDGLFGVLQKNYDTQYYTPQMAKFYRANPLPYLYRT